MQHLIRLTDEEIQEDFENRDFITIEELENKYLDLKNEKSKLEEQLEDLREDLHENYTHKTPKEMGWE